MQRCMFRTACVDRRVSTEMPGGRDRAPSTAIAGVAMRIQRIQVPAAIIEVCYTASQCEESNDSVGRQGPCSGGSGRRQQPHGYVELDVGHSVKPTGRQCGHGSQHTD